MNTDVMNTDVMNTDVMNTAVMDTAATPAEQSLLENAAPAWTPEAVMALFEEPFGDLLFNA